eukprot:TRINITY_DN108747_c0_g1_i1.p1 TRINITY_DN108747_c0_g1~~TRINITY_DN108747_c0_g1_i1.p1  ORF type:complete len:285 (-),score=45.78 TRINITY_DN108747_c0_g1_i1:15-869(-)
MAAADLSDEEEQHEEDQKIVPRLGHGTREHRNPTPLVAGRKVQHCSMSTRPSSQADTRRPRQPMCVPPGFREDSFLRGRVSDCNGGQKWDETKEDTPGNAFFCKPPYLFAEPLASPLFRLKASLMLDDEGCPVKEVKSRSKDELCSSEWERDLLASTVGSHHEVQVPEDRPRMPAKLKRHDLSSKSRAKYNDDSALQHLRDRQGMHRKQKSAAQLSKSATDLPKGISDLTYYSFRESVEWKMPRRAKYKVSKSRQPLEGWNGRVKPGVFRQPEEPLSGPSLAWE